MARDADTSIELETLFFCRELYAGGTTAAAVASPRLSSYGSESAAISDLQAYLATELVTQPPRIIGRYHLPPNTTLRVIRVPLDKTHLGRRLARTIHVDFASVLVPDKRDHWVIVPAIDHTLYVSHEEPLEAAVVREVQRIVGAQQDTLDFRRVLPERERKLVPVTVTLEHEGRGVAGRARAIVKRRIEEHKDKRAAELLSLVATPLHQRLDEAGVGPRLYGRDREMEQLAALLGGKSRHGVVLVGRPACGKSALLRHWLYPERKRRRVYATSAAQLVAGMSAFGAWQERVGEVLSAAEHLDAILYFDNLAELLGERPRGEGIDVAGALRPWVVEERVRVVGELTPETLDQARRQHVSLFGALNQLRIEPLSGEETTRVLVSHMRHWRETEPERPIVLDEIAAPIVELATRYLPYAAFPGKAIRFVDELRATVEAEATPVKSIGLDRAYDAFSLASGIPAFLLREDRALHAGELMRAFARRIVGQERAVRHLVETICVVKARLQPAGKPLATLLFAGPTGVGKTELARTLASFLFGSEERMVRFDMSEYTDPAAAQRLIAGTAEQPGLLTSKVREQPFCVLLLDEIEKAHTSVHDLLLQVLGEGRLSDSRGQTTYFVNAIIILTSNLGATHKRHRVGLGASEVEPEEAYTRAVQQAFRPELINRLDRVIAFHALSQQEVERVVGIALERICERRGLEQGGVTLALSDGALAQLAREGHSDTYGVRALRRHLEQRVVAPVAELMSTLGQRAKGTFIWVCQRDEPACPEQPAKQRVQTQQRGDLRLEMYQRPAAGGRRALRGVWTVLAIRRRVDRLMLHERAEQVREQIASLRSQLATFDKPRKKSQRKMKRAEIALMERQRTLLHRLSVSYEAAATLQSDIHVAEQLALGALYDAEEARGWTEEVEEMERRFDRAFFYVLVADREHRDAISLKLDDADGAGPIASWLRGLVAIAPARRWQIRAHVPGKVDKSDTLPRDWPADCGWTPPRDLAWVQEHLVQRRGEHKTAMLLVDGRDAAVVLCHEAGLHRFLGLTSDNEPRHMWVSLIDTRTEFEPAKWKTAAFEPRHRSDASPKQPAVRDRTPRSRVVQLAGRTRMANVPDDAYWERIEEIALQQLLHDIERDAD